MAKEPYLVQRINLRSTQDPNRKGVDRYFSMDYMGSAEFEFGELPKSLKRIRSALPTDLKKMQVGGYTAWYCGPETFYEVAMTLFEDALEGRHYDHYLLKESLRLQEAYGFYKAAPKCDIVGWWDILNDFAFFTKKEYAKNWLKGLSDKKDPAGV